MVSFYPLFSGSQGNSMLIEAAGAKILIDVGVSARRITKKLASIGFDAKEIDALLITHDHADHMCGVRVLNKNTGINTYATGATLGAGNFCGDSFHPITPGDDFCIGDVRVTPFSVMHDALDPVGYRFYFPKEDAALSIITDLGQATSEVMEMAIGSDLLYIESNHDLAMLKNGSYPYFLKRRILSQNGHLSNDESAKILTNAALEGTKTIILAHLSQNNNTPRIALDCAKNALSKSGVNPDSDIILHVAKIESDGEKFAV